MLSKKYCWTIQLSKNRLVPPLADLPAVRGQRHYGAGHPLLVDPYGGEYRARPGDLRLAKTALAQLSLVPVLESIPGPFCSFSSALKHSRREYMVGLPGFEPGTSPLSGARSAN